MTGTGDARADGCGVDDLRALCLALPSTIERPSYGTPGFRVRDRLFARVWDGDEEDVAVLWTGGLDEKEGLLAATDGACFTTAHYDGHPHVLVRLPRVARDELADLVEDAWRARAPARLVAEHDAS